MDVLTEFFAPAEGLLYVVWWNDGGEKPSQTVAIWRIRAHNPYALPLRIRKSPTFQKSPLASSTP
jgi:hypothetical protein